VTVAPFAEVTTTGSTAFTKDVFTYFLYFSWVFMVSASSGVA
jgi:hypothetical protein